MMLTSNGSGEDDNSEDESSSVQPSIPSDVFGGALNLPLNKRKRKAAWVDKDDADIMVKDVVATYTKAKGKHGLAEVSEELYGKALNRKFKSVVGEPAWASLDKEEGGDSDEEFLRETTNLTQKRSKGSLAWTKKRVVIVMKNFSEKQPTLRKSEAR